MRVRRHPAPFGHMDQSPEAGITPHSEINSSTLPPFDVTFTAMSDNAAWAPSESDLRNLVAIISTANGAWFAAGTPSAARVECSQRYDLDGTSLFGQLVTRGTPTFAATDDVTVIIGLLQD